jgi:anion-transporting  ArsA/GET3 family ATPase
MIKTAFKYIVIIFTSLSIFWACEPCEDCGPDDAYPYFNLSILNKTSLDTLNQYRSRLNNEIKAVDTELKKPENSPVADSLNNLKAVKSDSLALINALIKITNEKTISIESINGKTNLFENRNGGDSLSKFRIPINTLETNSEYIFKIEFADSLRLMKIEYQLYDTTINSKITKSVRDLQVIEHQFDSLRGPFGCRPLSECISNELEIYVEI